MIAAIKFLLVFTAALSLAVAPVSSFLLISTAVLFSLISLHTRAGPKHLLARNVPVALFAVFFMGMAALSAAVRGDAPSAAVAVLGARIVLVFNAAYLGGRWIGRFGLFRLVDVIPSERVRLFLVLLVKQAHSLLAANRGVIDALRSRLVMDRRGRRIVARYYVQNMVFRELRSIRNLQAALYARLPDTLNLYHRPAVFGPADALIAAAALFCAVAAMPHRWFPAWIV